MLDLGSEMRDFFIHRQHTQWAIFTVPRKHQYPESYPVPDNDRRIAVQAHFSGPQEQRGSIQKYRL